jgi:hypothetical protein
MVKEDLTNLARDVTRLNEEMRATRRNVAKAAKDIDVPAEQRQPWHVRCVHLRARLDVYERRLQRPARR